MIVRKKDPERERWFRRFRVRVETLLRDAEADVRQPHWSDDDPLPLRLSRVGADKASIDWITWWIEAYDRLRRGELLDRTGEPPVPECFKGQDQENGTQKDFGRQDDNTNDFHALMDLWFWFIVWGPTSLDREDGDPVITPDRKSVV
jgi:hypothetical protein